MTTVEIDGTKVTKTKTPNTLLRMLGARKVVTIYTILDRTFTRYPSFPVLMDKTGAIMCPLSKIAELVKNKARLMKYTN